MHACKALATFLPAREHPKNPEGTGEQMPQTEFKSQKELQDYAERNGLEYAWEYTPA
jgi:hypothetical protein